jgi:hypothetical protein
MTIADQHWWEFDARPSRRGVIYFEIVLSHLSHGCIFWRSFSTHQITIHRTRLDTSSRRQSLTAFGIWIVRRSHSDKQLSRIGLVRKELNLFHEFVTSRHYQCHHFCKLNLRFLSISTYIKIDRTFVRGRLTLLCNMWQTWHNIPNKSKMMKIIYYYSDGIWRVCAVSSLAQV